MKICYLSDANSIHTKKWCDFFKEKGYEIHVISLNKGEIDGVFVHHLNFELSSVKDGSSLSKIKYLTALSKVKEIVSKINPDILHAHYATSYGLLGALCNFHPYILSVWGSDVFDFPNEGFIKKMILKYNLSKADKILSTSKVMAKETNLYTDKPIEVTPFGVNIDLYKPSKDKNLNEEKITIGTIKTLEPKYGIEYLIRAFAIVKDKFKDKKLKLEIGGKGNQKEYLEKLCKELGVQDEVEFLGFLSIDEVISAFNRFDIAVFPSTLDSESFGVAAVESQACGTPVIVSNVGGLPEATSPDFSSILVPKEDSSNLSMALAKLIEDKKLREQMGINGRKFVEDNYNIEDNFNKVNEIYKNMNRQ